MADALANLTQVIYQIPKVGEIYIGQLSATEVALREAQLAEARRLRREAETVSQAKELGPANASLSESRAPRPRPQVAKRAPKAPLRSEEDLDDTFVVDVRV